MRIKDEEDLLIKRMDVLEDKLAIATKALYEIGESYDPNYLEPRKYWEIDNDLDNVFYEGCMYGANDIRGRGIGWRAGVKLGILCNPMAEVVSDNKD